MKKNTAIMIAIFIIAIMIAIFAMTGSNTSQTISQAIDSPGLRAFL